MDTPGLTDSNIVEFKETRKDVCPFCDIEETIVPEWREKIVHHLIITIDEKGHCHVHGPINDIAVMGRMIGAAKTELAKNLNGK